MQRRSLCSPRATVSFAFWICCAKNWLVAWSKNSATGHWNELKKWKRMGEKQLRGHEQIGVQIFEKGNILLRFLVLRHNPLCYQLQKHFKVRQRRLSLNPSPINHLNNLRTHCCLSETGALDRIFSPFSQSVSDRRWTWTASTARGDAKGGAGDATHPESIAAAPLDRLGSALAPCDEEDRRLREAKTRARIANRRVSRRSPSEEWRSGNTVSMWMRVLMRRVSADGKRRRRNQPASAMDKRRSVGSGSERMSERNWLKTRMKWEE